MKKNIKTKIKPLTIEGSDGKYNLITKKPKDPINIINKHNLDKQCL